MPKSENVDIVYKIRDGIELGCGMDTSVLVIIGGF